MAATMQDGPGASPTNPVPGLNLFHQQALLSTRPVFQATGKTDDGEAQPMYFMALATDYDGTLAHDGLVTA
ncbi:MAG: hypothetical protein E5V77_09045, partial [Mesorhizobium sp.]